MEKEQWQEKGQGHRQRLRDRFLERGLENFTDAEVLELLLTFGTPRSDCILGGCMRIRGFQFMLILCHV